MSTEVRWRRGSAAQNDAFIGAAAEITVDTTAKDLRIHDGSTPGGHALLGRANERLPVGWLYGMTLSNSATSATNTINISAGSTRDELNSVDIRLVTGISKSVGALWSSSGTGGLDTGTVTANSWYHVFAIRNGTSGAVSVLLSKSLTNPTMPVGWAAKRRIGSFLTDGASAIRQFRQAGDSFQFVTPPELVASASLASQSRQLKTVAAPLGLKIQTEIMFLVIGSSAGSFSARDGDLPLGPGSGSDTQVFYRQGGGAPTGAHAFVVWLTTDVQSRIAVYDETGITTLRLFTRGYMDRRGRDDA